MKTEFGGFRGTRPRSNPALLGASEAQRAENCTFSGGDLRSLKGPAPVVTPAPLGDVIRSIYRIGQSLDETKYWLTWTTDVDVVRGPISTDPDERTYFTGDGYPKVTTLPLATQGGDHYPVNAYRLGVERPSGAPFVTPLTTAAPIETRAYVYTFVSILDEEGPPSLPRLVDGSATGAFTISGMDTAPPKAGAVYKAKRIYRSVDGTGGTAAYRFVAEIPLSQDTYLDAVPEDQIGEVMVTTDYDPPPETMRGLTSLPNGILAAFDGLDVLFCEPFLPYAWPRKYRLTVDYPIVGLGAFGGSLLVLTTGVPYLITGVDPDSMSMEKTELDQACVSKRSIVEAGGAVIFASQDGLVSIGVGGTKILTAEQFKQEEWTLLQPETIEAEYTDGRYIANTATGGFLIDVDGEFIRFTNNATAGYRDQSKDTLYQAVGGAIVKFNRGAALPYVWQSKLVQQTGYPLAAWCRVDADSYPVTFTIRADLEVAAGQPAKTLTYTKTVNDHRPFRLPAPSSRPRQFDITIAGTNAVRYVALADAATEFEIG